MKSNGRLRIGSILVLGAFAVGATVLATSDSRADDEEYDDSYDEAMEEAEEARREAMEEAEEARREAIKEAKRAARDARRGRGAGAGASAAWSGGAGGGMSADELERARAEIERARGEIERASAELAREIEESVGSQLGSGDAQKLAEWGKRLGATIQAKVLEDLRARLDDMNIDLDDLDLDDLHLENLGDLDIDVDLDPGDLPVPPGHRRHPGATPPTPPVPPVAPVPPLPPVPPSASASAECDPWSGPCDADTDADALAGPRSPYTDPQISFDDLDLSDAQREKLRTILDGSRKAGIDAEAKIRTLTIDLRRELDKLEADEGAVAEYIDAITAEEAKVRKARILAWARSRKVLSEEQLEKVERARARAGLSPR